MQNTMELFSKALEIKHASAWAREFNITPEAFSMAKKQGRLSPVLAGNIAIELGEDPEHWIAVAAIEATKESELLARLKNRVNSWRRLCLSNHKKEARQRGLFSFKTAVAGLRDAIYSTLDARSVNVKIVE